MIELLERFISPASVEVQPDLTPEFILPDFDEEAFEAEFANPAEQEPAISVSMRMATFVGATALVTAGAIGYAVGQPAEKTVEISAAKIEKDLNKDNPAERTSEPIPYMQDAELVIPKQESEDPTMSLKIPIHLGNDKYGVVTFEKEDNDCKADILEVDSTDSPEPITKANGEKGEIKEVVYPISVVYTTVKHKDGTTEKVCSVVAGDESGNAADVVKINKKEATPEQRRLLGNKGLNRLVKDAVGLASQERVGYLEIAS